MPKGPWVTARCVPRGAAQLRIAERALSAVGEAAAAGARGAGAAGVADSKRNFVYGLHAVNAVLERAPERLLELWMAQPRDDARARDLRDRAQALGVRVQSAGGEA